MLYRYEASKGLAESKGKKMLTDTQQAEVYNLIRQLSADLTVAPEFIVEVMQIHENIKDSVYAWLTSNSIAYADILAQFNEVF